MAARRIVGAGIGLIVVLLFGVQLVRSAMLIMLLPILAYTFLFLTLPRVAAYVYLASFTMVGVIPFIFPSIGYLTSGFFSVTTGLTLMTGFLGVIYFLLTRANPLRYRTTVPFIVLMFICVLSSYFSVDRVIAVRRVVKFICSFIFTLVVAESFTKKEHFLQGWKVILYLSVIPLGVSAFQLATGRVPYYARIEMSRISGTFTNSNAFGIYLVLLCTIALALTFLAPGRFVRFVRFGFFLALGACLVLTRSRGAWIGFTIMLVVFSIATKRKRILLLTLPLIAATILLSPATRARIQDQAHGGAWEWRVRQWEMVLPYVKENPLLGAGMGSSYINWLFGDVYYEGLTTGLGSPGAVHNTYLQFVVENGILGLAAFLWMLWVAIRIAYMALKSFSDDRILRMSAALTLGFLLSFSVMAINWSFFPAPDREVWFWFTTGMAEALYRMSRGEDEAEEKAGGDFRLKPAIPVQG